MFGTSAYAEAALADPGSGAISLVVTSVQGTSSVGSVSITADSNLAVTGVQGTASVDANILPVDAGATATFAMDQLNGLLGVVIYS
jgi:hypothetical protein